MSSQAVVGARGKVQNLANTLNKQFESIGKASILSQRLRYGSDKSRAIVTVQPQSSGWNIQAYTFNGDDFAELTEALNDFLQKNNVRVLGLSIDYDSRWRGMLLFAATEHSTYTVSGRRAGGADDIQELIDEDLASSERLDGFDFEYRGNSGDWYALYAYVPKVA